MISLNLEKLGVSEKALENAILSELGLSREQAVKALAEKFGVDLSAPAAGPVANGSTVKTTDGEATALILSDSELSTLKQAAAISNRIFS